MLGIVVEFYFIGCGMGYECSGIVIVVGFSVIEYCVGDCVIVSLSGLFIIFL